MTTYKDKPFNRFRFVTEKKINQNIYVANYLPSSNNDNSSGDDKKSRDQQMDEMDSIKEH